MKRIIVITICILSIAALRCNAQIILTDAQLEQKRIADSTAMAQKKTVYELRQDSIANALKKGQKTPSQKQNIQKKNNIVTKSRQEIQDSIAAESKKAAAARKAQKRKTKDQPKTDSISPSPKTDNYKTEKDTANSSSARQDETEAETFVVRKEVYRGGEFILTERFIEPPERKKTFFSFQIGASNCLTDLGGNSRIENNLFDDLNFRDNTFFYGFSLSHLRYEAIGLRLSYVFGKIAASDKNTYFISEADPAYNRYVRNLDFQSKISEGSLMLEVHPLKFIHYTSQFHQSYLQPYFLLGIGTYSFNPQGSYYDPVLDEDVWVDLQPLGTEGQGSVQFPERQPYKLSQWNIPYGFGFNYEISRTINLGLEFVGRKLFTDYLDDVSSSYVDPTIFDQTLRPENAELAKLLHNKSKLVDAGRAYSVGDMRGNPAVNDMYFSISGRISIKLNRNKNRSAIGQEGFYRYDDNEICD